MDDRAIFTPADRRAFAADLARGALRDEIRCVGGEPGVGRTTLLREVAHLVAPHRPVRQLVATGSSAEVPLGVFLGLVDRVAPLFEAEARLRLELADLRPLIIADDAHLLDAASATLLLELGRLGVPILLSVRARRTLPPAVAMLQALAAGGTATLRPFTDRDVVQFVRARLRSTPDPGLVGTLLARTGGVPAFLGSAVEELEASGRLARRAGVVFAVAAESESTAVAPPSSPDRSAVPADLGAAARRALRLTAVAGTVPEPVLRGLVGAAAIEEAEEDGCLAVRVRDGHATVEARHPFVGEAVSRTLSTSARLGLLADLVAAWPPATADPAQAARRVLWRLELGEAVADDELLVGLAGPAGADPAIARELAAVLRVRELDVPRRLRCAELLVHRRQLDDAQAMLRDLRDAALTDSQRRRRDLARAFLLCFPHNDPVAAMALLLRLPADESDHTDDAVIAHLATARLQAGAVTEAVATATPVAMDPSAPGDARAHAALTVAAALVHAGDTGRYARLRPRIDDLLTTGREQVPEGEESFTLIDDAFVLECREDLDAAQRRATAHHQQAIEAGDESIRALHAHHLARIALERGAAEDALAFAVGAAAADGPWSLALHAWIMSTLVECLVLTGHLDEANDEWAALRRRRRPPLHDIDVARAGAVVQARGAGVDDAGDRLASASARALGRGQLTRGRYAAEQAIRYRSDAAARAVLRLRVRHADPALDRARALARGWLDRDPDALDHIARAEAGRGFAWRALETALLAAGLRPPGEQPLVRRLRSRCAGLRSPVDVRPSTESLTPRERLVAAHAAAGMSDLAIAAVTGISVRTVQTHLTNAYHKLGIHGRADLDRALGELDASADGAASDLLLPGGT